MKETTQNNINATLMEIISHYDFKPYGFRGTKWERLVNNDSNCQSKIFIHLLDDIESVRISVSDEDSEYIDAIDMFKTKDMSKIINFIELVV